MSQHVQTLNAFDAAPGRTVVVKSGDLFELGIKADLLVISAKADFYEPVPGTMVKVLRDRCGISVGELRQKPELDLTASPTIRGWVSPLLNSLDTPPSWPVGSQTRFRRLVVVESPVRDNLDELAHVREGTAFQQLFRLLAMLPLHGIPFKSLITPLLNTGEQKELPEALFPAILDAVDNGFRHVADLQSLIIADLKHDDLQRLCDQINTRLHRTPLQRTVLMVKEKDRELLIGLRKRLEHFQRKHKELIQNRDVAGSLESLIHELEQEQITLVVLGIESRRLLEVLVRDSLHQKKLDDRAEGQPLFKQINQLGGDISAWSINAIHTVRTFGNWMGHATPHVDVEDDVVPRREVSRDDMLVMLLSLQRVLEDYPWPSRVSPKRRRRRRHPGQKRTPRPMETIPKSSSPG